VFLLDSEASCLVIFRPVDQSFWSLPIRMNLLTIHSGIRTISTKGELPLFTKSIQNGDLPFFAKSIQNGDRNALSRAITLLESRLPSDQQLGSELFGALSRYEAPPAIRLGFSGAPGVGKSTLIERFGMFLVREQQKRLAVLVPQDGLLI
jgi:hypothetical protein